MSEPAPSRHYARTRDGWHIAVHHLPPTPAATRDVPVVLCHGMTSNRFNMNGPGRVSLARYLHRRGYDVWLLELRGAGYSRRQVRLPPVPYRWTFEDYVQHDVPAALKLVCELTSSERVLWVGHSLGGMVAYAASMTPIANVLAGVVTLGSPAMTEVGHETLNQWIRFRYALRLAPARIPTRALAWLAVPVAGMLVSTFSTLIRDWSWHPDNVDLKVMRFMLRNGIEDVPRSLLIEFARWYEARRMSDRYNLFSFAEHLERITVPMLVMGGGRDRLTPPGDLERLVERIGSRDKKLVIAGHSSGFAHEYSHVDLVLGRHAPDEIYPIVGDWLDAHALLERAAGGERNLA